jgi:hypothetical protein
LASINRLLRLNPSQEAEAIAAQSNMTQIAGMLHDPSSQFMDKLLAALKEARPDIYDDQERNSIAFIFVTRFSDKAIGKNEWRTGKRPKVSGGELATWIVLQK